MILTQLAMATILFFQNKAKILHRHVFIAINIPCKFSDKGQSWGFTSRSTARVILGQVLRIATCGTRTHRGDSL